MISFVCKLPVFPLRLGFWWGRSKLGTPELMLLLELGRLGPFCIVGGLLLEWAVFLFVKSDCSSG